MSKKITFKQLKMKKFNTLEMSDRFRNCFGDVEKFFIMIIWGQSAQGKSNFVIQLMEELYKCGKILYLSLEESLSMTLQRKVMQHLSEDAINSGNIAFTDHTITLDELIKILGKRSSPKIIIVDSVQYFGISYTDYKHLKALFPRKTFIFISHAKGKLPDGKTADKIRYDAGIKVRVEGKIAFIESRYGGTENWVIWEEGAKRYWGKKFKSMLKRV